MSILSLKHRQYNSPMTTVLIVIKMYKWGNAAQRHIRVWVASVGLRSTTVRTWPSNRYAPIRWGRICGGRTEVNGSNLANGQILTDSSGSHLWGVQLRSTVRTWPTDRYSPIRQGRICGGPTEVNGSNLANGQIRTNRFIWVASVGVQKRSTVIT